MRKTYVKTCYILPSGCRDIEHKPSTATRPSVDKLWSWSCAQVAIPRTLHIQLYRVTIMTCPAAEEIQTRHNLCWTYWLLRQKQYVSCIDVLIGGGEADLTETSPLQICIAWQNMRSNHRIHTQGDRSYRNILQSINWLGGKFLGHSKN